MRFVFCPYLTFLIIIFSVFFLHTVFILNEDHILIAAYESGDAGNFAHAMMRLFNEPVYNHHNYYFGSNHGWVISDISFFVILVLKFFGQILGWYEPPIFGFVDDRVFFNGAIRTINFAFALASVLLFFQLSHLLFENKRVSFIASLFFMLLPWAAIYSYWLKPDATGLFFILVAILYLVKFVKQAPKLMYFYLSFVSLVLATFSKMYHGFLPFPILLLFFLSYCDKQGISYLSGLFSTNFLKVFMSLPFIYLLIIFLVHPYSIFDYGGGINDSTWIFKPFEVFIKFFESLILGTLSASTGSISDNQLVSTSLIKNFYIWLTLYKTEPLIYLNTFLLYLLIIPLFFRHKFNISLLFIISIIFCQFYLLIVIYGTQSGKHYDLRYIYPIAPLLILNLVAFGLYIWNLLGYLPIKNRRWLKIIVASLGILFILPVFAKNLLVTTNSLLARAAYQQSTLYQTRKFILNNVSTFSQQKMLFDLGTAPVPPKATWVKPHAEMSWVPSKIIDSKRFKDYINPNAPIIWVSWESSANGPQFIENIQLQFLIVNG
jgi:hypothetical protein